MKIYIFWLVLVILCNFGFPTALPIEDVVIAITLSIISFGLKKISIIITSYIGNIVLDNLQDLQILKPVNIKF